MQMTKRKTNKAGGREIIVATFPFNAAANKARGRGRPHAGARASIICTAQVKASLRWSQWPKVVLSEPVKKKEKLMAKTIATRKSIVRRDWTRADVKELRQHSRDKTPVKTISRALRRTPGALRQKARVLGIPLGHRRPKRRRA